ncbi:MAG: SCO family protein [bacterium]
MKKQQLFSFLIVGLISVGLGIYVASQTKQQPAPKGYPGLGGEFTLQSANGPVSLSDYKGKAVALYFGFAQCPDICPTTLSMLANAFKQLSTEEQQKAQGIFISVDPGRDTPEILAEYAPHFYPDFVGVTGTEADIANITKRYGVLYLKVDAEDSEMGYTMDHSSVVFIIDGDGVVQALLRHGDTTEQMAAKLKEVIGYL